MKSLTKLLSLALFALLIPVRPLAAQGLSVYTHSACMLARGGAGVAGPCSDGSAVFYSPAALALQTGAVSAGIIAIQTESEFTFDAGGGTFESTQPLAWVPHGWASVRPGPRLALALGVYAPYGLKTEWPLDFEGRFVGYDNELRGIYIQPTVAYQIVPGRFSLGAGVAIVSGSVEINQRLDLAETLIPGTDVTFAALGVPRGTDFADLRLEGDAWTATFHLGAHVRANERLEFGIRYLHTADLDVDDGTADFTQIETGIPLPPGNPFGLPAGTPIDVVLAPLFGPGGPLSDQRLRTDLTLPNQLVLGARYQVNRRFAVVADYQWTGWNSFDEAPLDFQRAPDEVLILDFENTSTIRLGADYEASDRWDLRTGIVYNDAAASDVTVTPLLPEVDRVTLAIGAGYRISDRFRADAGFEYIFPNERRGRVRPRTSRTQTAAELNVGEYESRGLAFGATLVYRLGR